MNTLALPLPSGRGFRRANIVNLAFRVAAGIRDGLRMLRRYKTLTYKSDVELARIGLKREELPRAVVTGRLR